MESPWSAAADDRFARPDVAELTIALATDRAPIRVGPEERLGRRAVMSSPRVLCPGCPEGPVSEPGLMVATLLPPPRNSTALGL